MNLTMRLFKHRDIWYVEVNGKRRSLKTRDRAEARRVFSQGRKEWLAGKLAHLTGECLKTIGEYRIEFLNWSEKTQPRATFRANRLALEKLIKHTGETLRIDMITRRHLDQMTADCRSSGLSTSSINIHIRHARACLNKAVEWRYVPHNPLAGAKELAAERTPPTFLRKEEAARFIAGIQDVDLRRMVAAYLVTGRRRKELLGLRWEDIDWQSGRYLIRNIKRGPARWFPITSMFKAVLISIGLDGTGPVFHRWQYPDTISKLVKRELVKAGLGHMRLQHLRHTFASLKAMEGLTLYEIQQLLGHVDIKATSIYAHLTDDNLSRIAEMNLGPVDLSDGAKKRSKNAP